MMSDKKLALLGIFAVVMAGLAILQHQLGRNAHTADFSGSALIEGLDIDAVATIHVAGDGGAQTVTLVRDNDRFVVSDKDNYPADVAKINRLINQCLDIQTTEKITSNPANHGDLKVTEDIALYRIGFLNSDGAPIVTLLLSDADPETNMAKIRNSCV